MPIRAVYTSPLERAIETAKPIAQGHDLEPRVIDELGEFRFGEWEGLAIDELDRRDDWRRFNTFRSGVRAPGGELMIETQARMAGQIELLRARHPDQIVAVVSHADSLRSLIAHCLGVALDHMLRFDISPASVTVVEAGDWAWRVLCLNATRELPV